MDDDKYITAVRRASGTSFNAQDEGTYINAVRRVSGTTLTKLPIPGTANASTQLVGHANAGVITATRRLSGVKAAIAESVIVTGDKSLNPKQIELTLRPGQDLTKKDLDLDKYGLGKSPWHTMSPQEIFAELGTRMSGLTDDEHKKYQEKYGFNEITPPKSMHWFVKFLWTLVGGFQIMLWFGSILCFIVYGLQNGADVQTLALAVVLIIVIFVTCIFQAYQEGKSDKVMAELKKLSPSNCFVYRNGELKVINAVELVPGDIVKVNGGEKVPADVRVLSSSDLKVNNASLTGENVDVKLGPEPLTDSLYEAKNIARSGCNFTSGNAIAVVFSTGDDTYFGNIAESMISTKRPDSLMKHEIHRLINIMAIVAFTLGIVFFILAFYNGYTWVEAVIFMIGIIVANVPEGLLPQMTVALTLTAQRMLKLGVLVSNLEIIETLGAVTVICSDKTGTLTENRMSVSHIVYDKTIFVHEGTTAGREGDSFPLVNINDEHFKALQRIATLNTDAVFLSVSDDEPDVLKKEVKGDASEAAMIKFFHPFRDIMEFRGACKRHVCIPFNSTNKWMASVSNQEGPDGDEKPMILMVKGAPEKIMTMCSHILTGGKVEPYTKELQEEMEGANEVLARRGERVLAFAHLELPRSKFPKGFVFDIDSEVPNFPLTGLCMVGFLALIDPPRMSVKPAIEMCNTAGIKVFMVTGDHPITAHAIAKSLNLITEKTKAELEFEGEIVPEGYAEAIVVHGMEMETFTEADWERVLSHKQIVFARTKPQQKQDIVKYLNEKKHIVAMTGDGVNDAPALKAAHVGIAMGSGASVAKEAAQMVLLNDDFGAIVHGIREGRLIFENLKKCIAYVLSSNIPEIIPFLLFIALKIPLAIETICILLIDLGTDLAPAVALAYEEPEDAIMQMPPRDEHAHMIGPQMMVIAYGTIGQFQNFAAFFAFFYVFYDYGFTLDGLVGAGIGFRTAYEDLSAERQEYFSEMCAKNTYYLNTYEGGGNNCTDEWATYRDHVQSMAQGAFLLTVVWAQIANILIRKTQVASIFEYKRFFENTFMLYSIAFEILLICFLVFTPKVNEVFLMAAPSPKHAACAVWIIPLLLIWDEVRKWLCRSDPNGWFNKYSNF